MTKNEVIFSLNKLGITLPKTGKTEFLPLKPIAYISLTKLENKYIDPSAMRFKFDMDNELLECYIGKTVGDEFLIKCYDNTTTPCLDVYDFSEIVCIATNYSFAK